MKKIVFLAIMLPIFTACVSKKQFAEVQSQLTKFESQRLATQIDLDKAKASLVDCDKLTAGLRSDLKGKDAELQSRSAQLKTLQEELDYQKKTNTNLLDRLSDLSVVSKTGAENIKKTLETMNEQSRYIKDLNSSVRRKDSTNLALVMNLKRSLSDINDEDVSIEVKKGVVYISISDKLLFKSGSAEINQKAETVLEKVARVVNDHKELDILVEGHTDNVPIATDCLKDNWDLSAKRATAVVRMLQGKFMVMPERMTAGGRSEFVPKQANDNLEGRKQNRRTEIIVTPKLDQFFQLLNGQDGK